MVIYEGPSMLDGSPIVAIATGDTSNEKTGDMVQVWILCANQAPHHAIVTGHDSAVCGNCPHRRGTGGVCYVIPFQAPLAVWTAYMNHSYEDFEVDFFEGRKVRFGAYGDPAAVPFDYWEPILDVCDRDASTGYTHQLDHVNFDPRILLFCQVSVDTPRQAMRAHARGLKTFRIAGDASKRLPGEIECLADSAGITCADCGLCNGQVQSIVIAGHGSRVNPAKLHDVRIGTPLTDIIARV